MNTNEQAKLEYQQHLDKVNALASEFIHPTGEADYDSMIASIWANAAEMDIIGAKLERGETPFDPSVADRASLAAQEAVKSQLQLQETIDNYEKLINKLTAQVQDFAAHTKMLETQLLKHTGLYVGTSIQTGEVLFQITPTEAYNKKWAGNIVHCLKGRLKSAYGCTWQKVFDKSDV